MRLTSTVTHSSSTSNVVDGVCECLEKLSSVLPDVSSQLVEARARLEMNEVTNLARSNVKASPMIPVTPASLNEGITSSIAGGNASLISSGATSSASQTLSRHKRDLALMHQKYLGGQFARSAVEISTVGSLRTMQQPASAPVVSISKPRNNETVLRTGGKVPRAPSPGMALLQERLRKAQAQFHNLTA